MHTCQARLLGAVLGAACLWRPALGREDEGGVPIPVPAPPDTRRYVPDTTAFPHSAIGYFYQSGCTGALISPRHVLTAGHCVADSNATEQEAFAPGYNGSITEWHDQPFGFAWAARTRLAGDYTNDSALGDYALVTLAHAVGAANTTGYFRPTPRRFANSSAAALEGYTLETAGYPDDKGVGYQWGENCTDVTQPADEMEGVLTLGCWVFYGQSGSPVWSGVEVHGGRGAGRRKAADLVALVSRGDYESTDSVLLDEDVVSVLHAWMQEDWEELYGSGSGGSSGGSSGSSTWGGSSSTSRSSGGGSWGGTSSHSGGGSGSTSSSSGGRG